ncbi:Putative siderophore binding protein [Parvularcula bermudensis HTCC2503]|uniref:Putative siderophore binding protein n=1 Tax=Parvularcula bermudensis (strain ATCC BAA-594 / HTCC2503 / KCTC 12087) TaxID=314260 RepID=E0TC99_PARBH|nr:gamma carbonic anhydrase family protein [Parvularcula bermudensis]ADM08532.1 Putative siderophore binding protein [Parvularcula bermudensis HTCC2503]
MTAALILPFEGKSPQIHETAFIAPGAVVIGDVTIGPGASVWYGCVLRADTNRIEIGARANVQDGSILHVDAPSQGGTPVLIGEEALVGHRCLLHGCTIEEGGFVGMGSTVLDKAVIEEGAFLAAGAFLAPGKRVPTGEMWGGLPARKLRDLKGLEGKAARMGAAHYVEEAKAHRAALSDAREDA